jgi:capsid protein
MKHFDPSKLAEDPAPSPRRFGATGGGYDATQSKGRRKAPTSRSRSEDAELGNGERLILGGSTRDLRRNFSVAAWMIRKHLDYVSTFSFQSRCSQSPSLVSKYGKEAMEALDDRIERLMGWWSRPENFDAGGRHSQSRMNRLVEALRTVDGDVLEIRRRDGTIQLVESDRIKNPVGAPPAEQSGLSARDLQDVVNGVLIDRGTGAARGYCVHKRDASGLTTQFDRLVPAAFAALHGYFDRYDQVRGITPLAAAVNQFRDLYESFDYTLVKNKVAQLFALTVYRDKPEALGTLEAEAATDAEGDESAQGGGYSADFGRGPMMLDLDPGDRAEVLESANPAGDTQAFWQFVIMIALKALDIPYSFFDESHTNYSGLRVAWLMYDQSANVKREDNRELLRSRTAWRLTLWVLDGTLELPDGMHLGDVEWDWISQGIPWVDMKGEIAANIAAVGAGLADQQTILKAQGKDPFEVIDRIAEFQAYAKSKGVTLSSDPALAMAAATAATADQAGGGGDDDGDKPQPAAGKKKTSAQKKSDEAKYGSKDHRTQRPGGGHASCRPRPIRRSRQ